MDVKVGLHKEGWVLENWCFWTVVLEETLESPLDCKKIKPVNPKGDKSWIFVGRTDAEAPVLWPADAKSRLIGKDPDAGKDWRQEGNGWQGMTWRDDITDSINMSLSKLRERAKDREAFPGYEARELQGRAGKKASELFWADFWGRPWASLVRGLTEEDFEIIIIPLQGLP